MAALLFQSTERQKNVCIVKSTTEKRFPHLTEGALLLIVRCIFIVDPRKSWILDPRRDSGFLELCSRFQSQDSGFQKQRFPRFHMQKIPGSGSGQKVAKTTFDDINTTSHLFFCS